MQPAVLQSNTRARIIKSASTRLASPDSLEIAVQFCTLRLLCQYHEYADSERNITERPGCSPFRLNHFSRHQASCFGRRCKLTVLLPPLLHLHPRRECLGFRPTVTSGPHSRPSVLRS